MQCVLKIHWNLKNPIKLSKLSLNNDEKYDENQINPKNERLNSIAEEQINFKATSVKDLNKKKRQQISWDDFSLNANNKNLKKNSSNNEATYSPLGRSHTVKYKSTIPKRTSLIMHESQNDVR